VTVFLLLDCEMYGIWFNRVFAICDAIQVFFYHTNFSLFDSMCKFGHFPLVFQISLTAMPDFNNVLICMSYVNKGGNEMCCVVQSLRESDIKRYTLLFIT